MHEKCVKALQQIYYSGSIKEAEKIAKRALDELSVARQPPVETGTHTADHSPSVLKLGWAASIKIGEATYNLTIPEGVSAAQQAVVRLEERAMTPQEYSRRFMQGITRQLDKVLASEKPAGEADHSRRAEMPPRRKAEEELSAAIHRIGVEFNWNLAAFWEAVQRERKIEPEPVERPVIPQVRQLIHSLKAYESFPTREWWLRIEEDWKALQAMPARKPASPEPRPAPPPLGMSCGICHKRICRDEYYRWWHVEAQQFPYQHEAEPREQKGGSGEV